MKKNVLFMTEIAIFTAVGLVLDFVANQLNFKLWANGGSISIAMLPIFIMAYRHGIKGGLLTGFLIGAMQLILPGAYLVNPVQVFLDYWGAYMVVGFAGVFSKQIINASTNKSAYGFIFISVALGGLLRYACHVASGYIFYSQADVPAMENFIFSLTYNGTYMIPSIILCAILLIPLYRTIKFRIVK